MGASILVGDLRDQDHRDEQSVQCLSVRSDAPVCGLLEEIPLLVKRFADLILVKHRRQATNEIANPSKIVQLDPNWSLKFGVFSLVFDGVLVDNLAVRAKGF